MRRVNYLSADSYSFNLAVQIKYCVPLFLFSSHNDLISGAALFAASK